MAMTPLKPVIEKTLRQEIKAHARRESVRIRELTSEVVIAFCNEMSAQEDVKFLCSPKLTAETNAYSVYLSEEALKRAIELSMARGGCPTRLVYTALQRKFGTHQEHQA